jgi:hypothetical protein
VTNRQSRAARIEAAARAFLTAFDDEKGRHYDEVMAADALRIALALPADPQPVAVAGVLRELREDVAGEVPAKMFSKNQVLEMIDRAAAKAAQHQETTMERPKIEGCACPPCSGEPPRTDTTRIQELLDRVGRPRDLVGESDMIDGDIWSMQCVLKEVWQALPACRNALDLLGVALTDHNHQWTDEQRTAYDTATEWLNKLWPERKQ